MKKICLCISFAAMIITSCNNSDESSTATTPSTEAKKDTVDTSVTDQWKIGVQLWTFRMFTVTQALDKVDSAGAKFIEAFPGQKMGGDFSKNAEMGPGLSAADRTKLKDLLKAKGITAVAFGVTDAKDAKGWQQLFEFAKDMGLQYVTVEPADKDWGIVDSLAGVYGVKAAIHDHPKPSHYWHPDSVLAAAKDHPNIGSCADLGHWSRSGLDVVECLKKLEGHIIGAHFKDVKEFGNPKADDVLTGTGVNKWPEIFAEMKRQGFKGMFSIEREDNWMHNMTDVQQEIKFFHEQVAALK